MALEEQQELLQHAVIERLEDCFAGTELDTASSVIHAYADRPGDLYDLINSNRPETLQSVAKGLTCAGAASPSSPTSCPINEDMRAGDIVDCSRDGTDASTGTNVLVRFQNIFPAAGNGPKQMIGQLVGPCGDEMPLEKYGFGKHKSNLLHTATATNTTYYPIQGQRLF